MSLLHTLKWIVILLVIVGAAFLVYAMVKIYRPFTSEVGPKEFNIAFGQTTKEIAHDLERAGIINDSFFFEVYVYFKKQGGNMQAGNYSLSSGMSIREVAAVLTQGKIVGDEVRLTVIEGWALSDIAQALQDAGIVTSEEFFAAAGRPRMGGGSDFSSEFAFLGDAPQSANLEGFLFPDTYLIDRDSTVREVVEKFLKNFDRKLTPEMRARIARSENSIYDVITLASIVEREVGRNVQNLGDADVAKLEEERRIIAGIFKNRLDIGMALESDATISYITGRKGARATHEELEIDSPYNTYKYRGLPPGPISNPSLDAIEAAINPINTDYLFFLTAPDGTAYYARTLEEHVENRQKYLQ
jgi:UPF0755 protein